MPNTQLPRRSPEEQTHLDITLRYVFEHRLCFNELLGFRVESLDPTAPKISFAMRHDLIGHFQHGRLHGGVIATVLDTVGGLAVTVAIAEKFNSESTDQVSQRFGRIGTAGGRIASVQMTLENEEGILIATGGGAYVVS